MNKLPMTAAGYSVLEHELKHWIRIDRSRLIEGIKEAIADDSNLAENAEYQAVKSESKLSSAHERLCLPVGSRTRPVRGLTQCNREHAIHFTD